MNIQEGTLEVQGLHLHTLTAGDHGSPVVLLHGGGVDSAWLSWERLLPVLAEGHRVYAADWPGYGDSDRPQADYSMEYYLGIFPALLQAWKLERADLVGLSMGGGIAIGHTLAAPHSVRRLVLVDSYGLQDRAAMHQLSYFLVRMSWLNDWTMRSIRGSRTRARASLKVLLHNPQAIDEPLVDRVLAEVDKPQACAAWTAFQQSEMLWQGARTCYMDRLVEIQAPTLIIHGQQDQAVPLKYARQAQARIAGSRLEVLDNCGHWPQRDRPEEFNRLVSEFLAG
jgi:pimeloyl-ACP methyl ester carboxylesterase